MLSKKICKIITHCFLVISFLTNIKASVEVTTVFGPLKLEGVFLKIYNTESMQRLKNIDRSGSIVYWDKRPKFTLPKFNMLEHALNVLWLVKYFGGSSEDKDSNKKLLAEEIAAFTKDISKPVFAHAAAMVFNTKDSHFQDSANHQQCLQKMEISRLISGADLTEEQITSGSQEFKLSEQSYPNMCANNIAYTVHLALMLKMVNEAYVKKIVNSLRYENGRWYFTSRKIAKKFANVQLELMKRYWNRVDYSVLFHITSLILRQALKLKRISKEDMQNCDDQQILKKLADCDDPLLKQLIAKSGFINNSYRVLKVGEGTPDFRPKFDFIGIDPLIYKRQTKEFKKLTELDEDFKKNFENAQRESENPPKIQMDIKSK